MRGNGRTPAWIGPALAAMRDRARRVRVWSGPRLAFARDAVLGRLQGRRGKAVVFAVGLGLLLAPGLARLRPDAPAKDATVAVQTIPALAPSTGHESAPGRTGDLAALERDWFQEQSGPIPSRPAPATSDASGPGYECILEPSDLVSIGSPITGRLETILVERSELVQQDQVVARLESTVEAAALEVAKARATADGSLRSRRATADLETLRKERAQHLFAGKAVSLDLRQEVETQARIAEAELGRAREDQRLAGLELEQARAALDRRTIRSPIPGVVIERLLSPGEVVDEETILRVARIDPLWVEALLPASEFGRIDVGMRAAVTPEVPGDRVHTAEVVMVDRVVDPASGTFSVRLELPNPGHKIPSGLHCQAEILSDAGE